MTSQKNAHKKVKVARIVAIVLSVILVFASVSFLAFSYYFSDKIFPNVYVAGINIGGKTKWQAKVLLSDKVAPPDTLPLQIGNKSFELSLKGVELSYDVDTSIQNAYWTYRKGNFLSDSLLQLASVATQKTIPLSMHEDNEKLDEYLRVTLDSSATPPVYPSISVSGETITIEKGKPGEALDIVSAKQQILAHLESLDFNKIALNSQVVDPRLTSFEEETARQRAQKLIGKSITITYEYTNYQLKGQKLFALLDPKSMIYEDKAQEIITKEIEPLFNRPPQDATFKFENGKVQEFKPAKDGIAVNEEVLKEELKNKIAELETTEGKDLALTLPVQTAKAAITTQEVNNLGINELIGRGSSIFKGSIASRIFNVGHASGKLNGVLIPPNTVFSFDDAVGDVSQLTGYKQAYIIQSGRTILGDGGGLCQVSTTLFRAAMNAGLPIIERRAHAYRVGYYEQDSGPGLDATVYVPTTDFKFKNDTPNTILIQTIFDPKAMTLAFELYGTKDGRVATLTKPAITKQIAPPEDKYIDDPTLPTGKVNQVEHKAWGATVKFDYSVTRNGETIYQKTFTSVYQPWGAVFMKGTGPV